MKTNWSIKKLGEIIILNYGKGIAAGDRAINGKNPIHGANGILGWTDKFLIEGEGIIVGRKGSAGEVNRVKGKFWPSDVTYYILEDKKTDIDYIYYLLKYLNLPRLAKGVKPGINRNDVYEIEIPVPPIEEQKRIVLKLKKILVNISEVKKIRQESIAEIKHLYEATIKQTYQKNNWNIKPLGQIAEINPKKSEIAKLESSIQVTFIPMSAVNAVSGTITQPQIKSLGEVRSGYTYFRENDVLFAKITPCMENGKAAIAKDLENNIGFGSTEFHVIRSTSETSPRWLHTYLRQEAFREEAQKHMTGTAGQQRVPKDYLENVEIPIPPSKEQEKIVMYLDDLSEKVQALQKLQQEQLQDLEALKQSVLHQAFQGEL